MKKNLNLTKFFNMLAFIAIVAVAVALTVGKIFPDLGNALSIVAQFIAYIVTAISAFYYVRPKKNIVFFITYVVACILIIVLMFI